MASLPGTLPELKQLNGELMAKLQSGTLDGQDRVALKQLLVKVMDRIEQVRVSTPSPPPASSVASTTKVEGEDEDEDGEYVLDTECRVNTRRNTQIETPPEAPKKSKPQAAARKKLAFGAAKRIEYDPGPDMGTGTRERYVTAQAAREAEERLQQQRRDEEYQTKRSAEKARREAAQREAEQLERRAQDDRAREIARRERQERARQERARQERARQEREQRLADERAWREREAREQIEAAERREKQEREQRDAMAHSKRGVERVKADQEERRKKAAEADATAAQTKFDAAGEKAAVEKALAEKAAVEKAAAEKAAAEKAAAARAAADKAAADKAVADQAAAARAASDQAAADKAAAELTTVKVTVPISCCQGDTVTWTSPSGWTYSFVVGLSEYTSLVRFLEVQTAHMQPPKPAERPRPTSVPLYQCPTCAKTFYDHISLNQHMCVEEPAPESRPSSARSYSNVASGSGSGHTCIYCNHHFPNYAAYQQHLPKGGFQCNGSLYDGAAGKPSRSCFGWV